MKENDFSKLVVVLNSRKELEYFRDRELTEKQKQDLLKVDSKLNQGIQLGTEKIHNPSHQDRSTYISNLLITALMDDNEPMVALCCSYLATRFPALKQVSATTHNDRITIQLIYDKEYTEASAVQFIDKNDLY